MRASSSWSTVRVSYLQAPRRYALNGGPFGSKLVSNDYVPEGVPVIRGANLPEHSRFSMNDFVFVSESKADELLPNNAHPGDLVFTQRGTLGQIGLIPRTSPFSRFVISQSQMKLTVDEKKADAAFLYYYFRAPRTVQQIHNLAFSTGVPHINLDILRNFEVRLPPLPAQERIRAILSTYDDLIENNTRRIKVLEEMAQAIYREWFVHFRFPGHKKVKLVNSLLGPIPEGWRVGQISDAASISRDSVNPADCGGETFEHFSIPAYDQGRLPTLDLAETIRSNKYVIAELCILLSKLNPRIPRVWLPILSGSHRAVASTEFLVLAAGSQSSREFLYCLCASPEFLGAFAGRALGTSTSHQRVKPDDFLSMEIVVPGKAITLEFSELVAPMLSAANTLRLKNQNLRQTRDLLLPKLISGELDVSDLDINLRDVAA